MHRPAPLKQGTRLKQAPMVDIQKYTSEILRRNAGSPFLFVGSGFSRRYIGIEDWKGLLQHFCEDINPIEYYLASADGYLPKAASLLSKDFNEYWWKSEKYAESRETRTSGAANISSALKYEISKHLNDYDLRGVSDVNAQAELNILRNINVDGIITTNWDLLLEEIFPDYRVFIGQEQLLFSNPQAIAEIYKIHGCISEPDSIVLTESDYNEFQHRNPYLAAKLITLFIEHPIFIIGYSLNDPHIQRIIFSIAACLSNEKLEHFSENLIFVKRSNGNGESIQKYAFSQNGQSVITTVLETDDFSKVYLSIDENKRKIPARILRYCKEQMYELVKSANPDSKIAVVDIDELDTSDEVEFLVGVGVANEYSNSQAKAAEEKDKELAKSGYKGLTVDDLFQDFINEKSKYDADILLTEVFPTFFQRNNTFIPIFRYLSDAGIKSIDDLSSSAHSDLLKIIDKIKKRGYTTKSYQSQYDRDWKDRSTKEIITGLSAEKATLLSLFSRLKKSIWKSSERSSESTPRSSFEIHTLLGSKNYAAYMIESRSGSQPSVSSEELITTAQKEEL